MGAAENQAAADVRNRLAGLTPFGDLTATVVHYQGLVKEAKEAKEAQEAAHKARRAKAARRDLERTGKCETVDEWVARVNREAAADRIDRHAAEMYCDHRNDEFQAWFESNAEDVGTRWFHEEWLADETPIESLDLYGDANQRGTNRSIDPDDYQGDGEGDINTLNAGDALTLAGRAADRGLNELCARAMRRHNAQIMKCRDVRERIEKRAVMDFYSERDQ
jgi:hypothetical protein